MLNSADFHLKTARAAGESPHRGKSSRDNRLMKGRSLRYRRADETSRNVYEPPPQSMAGLLWTPPHLSRAALVRRAACRAAGALSAAAPIQAKTSLSSSPLMVPPSGGALSKTPVDEKLVKHGEGSREDTRRADLHAGA